MFKRKLLLSALALVSVSSFAADSNEYNSDLSTLLSTDGQPTEQVITRETGIGDNAQIKQMVTLPIKSMKAIKTESGEIMFISENGRFAFVGEIFDAWHGRYLEGFDQIKEAAKKTLDLEHLGLDSDLVGIVRKGQGKEVVSIMVDPQCQFCHDLIKQADKLYDDYTFEFIITPVMGEKSVIESMAFLCSEDKDVAWEHFVDRTLGELGRPVSNDPDCNPRKLTQAVQAHQLMGLNGVPVVIAPNKHYKEGVIEDLEEWLEQNHADSSAVEVR